MGQKQIKQGESYMIENWKPHPQELDVFTNIITNEQVQRHCVQIGKEQQITYQKRIQEHHASIVRVLYYHILQVKPHSNEKVIEIFTDKFIPLSPLNWSTVNTTLSILKGFRRLSGFYGFMRVNINMIGANEKGEIKLWINANPVINEVNQKAQNEEQMLGDIIKVIMNNDTQTSSLLVGCRTLNEAIHNILINMAEPKNQYFGNRVNLQKQSKGEKLTYEHSDKYYTFNQSEKQKAKKVQQNWKNSSDPRKNVPPEHRPDQNYLQNVRFIKAPKYIQKKDSPEKEQKKKFISQRLASETNNPFQYQHIHHRQLQPNQENYKTLQFNSNNKKYHLNNQQKNEQNQYQISNESSWGSSDKFQKQNDSRNIENKNKRINKVTGIYSPQNYHTQTHQSQMNFNKLQNEKKSPWKRTIPEEPVEKGYDRKSDLHKEMVPKTNEGRTSGYPPFIMKRKKLSSKNADPITEDETHRRTSSNEKKQEKFALTFQENSIPISRTRTQDFSNLTYKNYQFWNSFGKSPRSNQFHQKIRQEANNFKMKQENIKIQVRKAPEQKKSALKINKESKPIFAKFNRSGERISKISQKVEQEEEEKGDEENTYEEKKAGKQKLAKQLKMQFNMLLTPTEIGQFKQKEKDEKALVNAKSSKDLLIKQKVQKKKATFAELKSEAMKILNDVLS